MLCVDQSLFISSVVPIVGVFVVVGHRWGRMIRFGGVVGRRKVRVGLVCRWFGGGSRLASEVRESSVVFKSRLGAVWGRSLSPVAIRHESTVQFLTIERVKATQMCRLRRSRRRIAAGEVMVGLVWERPRILVRR